MDEGCGRIEPRHLGLLRDEAEAWTIVCGPPFGPQGAVVSWKRQARPRALCEELHHTSSDETADLVVDLLRLMPPMYVREVRSTSLVLFESSRLGLPERV